MRLKKPLPGWKSEYIYRYILLINNTVEFRRNPQTPYTEVLEVPDVWGKEATPVCRKW